ncbi:hypothetical protein SteCoe_29138 [Stentor coeruleus]|uniref:Carboxypeptidase n=1 Tax=Stentor coeruleus TaxID=5963 RepID=A0A1R2B6K1_9CILI|nr:hypothetical protein SteCoe_29138 [Stentor coeruleus]
MDNFLMIKIFLFITALAFGAPLSHKVTSLPGITLTTDMYSGYLQIPDSNGRELHYVFYTSQNNATTDPVVLWLNGGPGCSSMEGAFMENGPYIFSETNNTMYVNPYTWNRNASMLYFEAPAGVGYSMMGSIINNNTGDNQTATDNLQALYLFFKYFPEFSSNSFFITGESYAGVYVPMLAYWINQSNTNNSNPFINLKGFMVGNAVTDWTLDDEAWPYFLYWHQLIDDTIYFPWVNNNCTYLLNMNPYCESLYAEMEDLFTGVNYYDIYRDCIHPDYKYNLLRQKWSKPLTEVLECVPDNALVMYLNNPKVRNALHINTTLGSWSGCVDLDYIPDYTRGSIVYYPDLVKSGMIINMYSGDTDSAVPTWESINTLNLLNLPVSKNWTQWFMNGQVAGFFMKYGENLRFNTIRGSGHMCIQWKPAIGFQMFLSFIQGLDLV